MKRITIAALGLVVGATAGCKDMGLEGNVPLEEARSRQSSALMAAISAPTESSGPRVIVDGRLWVPYGEPLTIGQGQLRAIGSADERTVYARSWDESPYDALFVSRQENEGDDAEAATIMPTGGDQWIELRPVRGRTGPVPAPAAAAEEH